MAIRAISSAYKTGLSSGGGLGSSDINKFKGISCILMSSSRIQVCLSRIYLATHLIVVGGGTMVFKRSFSSTQWLTVSNALERPNATDKCVNWV